MALAAIMDMSASRDRAGALSYFQASTYVAAASGPVLGGIIAELCGFQGPFIAFAAISGLLALWMVVASPRAS